MALFDFFKRRQERRLTAYSPKIKQWLEENLLYRYQSTAKPFEMSPRGGSYFSIGSPVSYYKNNYSAGGGNVLIRRYIAASKEEIKHTPLPVPGTAAFESHYAMHHGGSTAKFSSNIPDSLYTPRLEKQYARNAPRYMRAMGMSEEEIGQFTSHFARVPDDERSLALRERLGAAISKKQGYTGIKGGEYPLYVDGEVVGTTKSFFALTPDAVTAQVPVANKKYLGDPRLTSIDGIKKRGIGAVVRRAISDIRSPAAEAILRWVSEHPITENPIVQQANRIRELAESMYAKHASIFAAIKQHGGSIYAPNNYYYGDIPLFNANQQIIGRNILKKVIPGLHDENLSAIASTAAVSENEVLDAIRGMERIPSTARGFYRKAAGELGLPEDTISRANANQRFYRMSAPLSELHASALTSADIASNDAFNEYASSLKFSSGFGVTQPPPRLALGPGKAPVNANEFWKSGPFNGYRAAGIGAMIVAGVGLTSVLMAKHAAKSMAYENRDKRRKHPYRSTKSIQTGGIFGG